MKYLLTYNLFELVNYSDKLKVNSYDELIKLLEDYNIPLDIWGTRIYKTPKHLWKEIQEEECTLYEKDGDIIREVQFVGAKIMCKINGKNYRLWEDRAVFKDGRIRIRPIEQSMAEKFKAGEDQYIALIRGLKEELGIEMKKNQFIYYTKETFEENGDYPGIRSYHTGYYYMGFLTEEQFNPKGYIEHQKDKDMYFVWREMKPKKAGHYPLPLGGDKAFENKKYTLFNAPIGSPTKIEIEGKPKLWGMLGPLPDNVIDYIKNNSKHVIDYRNGEVALHPTTKEPYIMPIVGKNIGDYYFFDESTGNWWTAHERFQGKAILLTPDEWNSIFLK